ncbi:amidohydrolase family protein [Fluoribacter gormanii]|uniref:amidohydrolase family protein n=1 Tax=Fluoribacter gormanii TaxID=464 RepID=UPI002244374D|nr:amidohydrolase family protein [Fluoribacter gormanii]MCW8443296.1 amidohydrolase family protein [Fluoribacter gormanii]
MKRRPILIRNTLLINTENSHYPQKMDLLIVNDTIEDIAPQLDNADAEIIDAQDMVAMPGLINTHIHVWQAGLHGVAGNWSLANYFEKMLDDLGREFSPEDMYLANRCGALEQIDAGVTCVLDWCNNINSIEHARHAIRGLEDSGIRAVFAYGTPGVNSSMWWFDSSEKHPYDAIEFFKAHAFQINNRIQMALALRGPDFTQDEVFVNDIKLARELNVLASMHVGVSSSKFGVKKIYETGLLNDYINFVHGNNLTQEEYQLIADHGASLSITPEVEMQMGHGFPATGKLLCAGGEPVLGTDIPSNMSGDLFTQLRFAIQTQRALDNQKELDLGRSVKNINLTCDKALDWITINGAKALHLDKLIGTLAPGKKADLILINLKDINLWPVHRLYESIIFYSNRHNVDTVIIDGKIMKRQGKLVCSDLDKLRVRLLESSERIVKNAKLL